MHAFYETRRAGFLEEAAGHEKRVRLIGNVRLAIVIAAVVVLAVVWPDERALWAVVLFATLLFAIAVRVHGRAREVLRTCRLRAELCRFGMLRAARDWHSLPIVASAPETTAHPYADDLDLFGRPSTTQLFGIVRTLQGQRILQAWLLSAAPIPEIRERQESVRVLASDIDFREAFSVEAWRINDRSQQRLEQFLTWAAAEPAHPMSKVTATLARVLPLTTVALMVAQSFDLIAGSWWLLSFAATSLMAVFGLRPIYRTFDEAFTDDPASLSYAGTFEVAERMPRGTPLLERLHGNLQDSALHIGRLERIMHLSDVRRAGIAALLLEVWFLWSFHVAIALERWRAHSRDKVRMWFESLGEVEALSSIATLAHDNPDWAFPQVDIAADRVEAYQAGHPMLPDQKRVHNDVIVGPPGTLVLITGSNMSGKSTLLRALGVNAVLAQAGAPVCAREFRMPPLRVYSSVNVHDSLADGVSLYMAQLKRLRQIVEAAGSDGKDRVLYLLDEILSGTNSEDRTTGVRAVIHHLSRTPSTGMLATHDLALVADEDIKRIANFVHFVDTFDPASHSMTFDYTMRPGPVDRSNALELMRMMGLPVE